MRFFFIDGSDIPKHCIYGPRPREAVFFNNWEWYVINDNLHRWNRDKEIADMYAAKERNKKEMSFNMTKTWQNTLASVKTQSEQRRIDKREKDRQEKIDEYNKILESRKEKRKPILERAKRTLFEGKDEVRVITSGIVESAVITEREKQIEFQNYLKEEQAKKDRSYAEKIFKDVEDYKKENNLRNIKNFQVRQKFRNELLNQIDEKKKRIEEAEEKERKAIEEDHIKMREAMERLKKCQQMEKIDKIKRRRMDCEKGYHAIQIEKSKIIEEEEENEINRMITKYSKRFKKEREEREQSRLKEAIENRAKIAENLHKNINKETANQDEIYEKVKKELDDERDMLENEKIERKKKWKLEMEKSVKEHKEKVEKANLIRKEALKWTIMQNERKKELDREWSQKIKKEAKEEKIRTANDYLKQMKEKREKEEENLKYDEKFIEKPSRDENKEILEYSREALEYARQRNFNNSPLLIAITKMKRDFGPPTTEITGNTKPEMPSKQPMGPLYYCFKK